MSPTDDPIERAFLPLRTPVEPTPDEIQAVRRRAERSASTPLRRARPAIAVLGVAAVAVAVAVGSAVDRGQPGTFVGEAGAREVLRAAADATRGDAVPTGWWWTRRVTVERQTVEGRRCKSCPTERGIVEQQFTEDVWTGNRGEAYRFASGGVPRAVENEPLLRAGGLLPASEPTRPDQGSHFPAASATGPDDAIMIGLPGWIADPASVPSDPTRITRWVQARITAQDRARRKRERAGGGRMISSQTRGERVASALVDTATSPQLSGPQKAAAFEALASLAVVTVDVVPPAFADPQRLAVRIAGGPAAKRRPIARPDRIIVFDRTSFRVVAEQLEDRSGDAKTTAVFVGPDGTRRMRVGGITGEHRYDPPVSVSAPGLDGDGRRLFDVSSPMEFTRDGQGVSPRKVGRERPPRKTPPQPKKVSKIK